MKGGGGAKTERRQMRACPRYNIRGDLVLPDRSKINRADQLNWESRNVDQILLLAPPLAFMGLQRGCALIYGAKR